MKNYRKSSHSVYDCKYHIVWITKYRKKVLSGLVSIRVRELLKKICEENKVQIIKGHVAKDHVHMFVSVPPQLAISNLVRLLKGTSSYTMMKENKLIQKEFWGNHFWGRGFFVATSGNITDEIIMEYIENQEDKSSDESFTVVE